MRPTRHTEDATAELEQWIEQGERVLPIHIKNWTWANVILCWMAGAVAEFGAYKMLFSRVPRQLEALGSLLLILGFACLLICILIGLPIVLVLMTRKWWRIRNTIEESRKKGA